jgi:predicted dehydrogenase
MTMTAAPAESDDGENIKWGIVGLGDVCQVKSGPAFWKCNGSTLSAVMRRTRGKAKEFANNVVPKENGCVGYEDIDQFLKHEGLEAVYVATRPGSHLEICSKVAVSWF